MASLPFVSFACSDILVDEQGSFRGRGRHPPGLTGREIGMWYASRAKKRNVKTELQNVCVEFWQDNNLFILVTNKTKIFYVIIGCVVSLVWYQNFCFVVNCTIDASSWLLSCRIVNSSWKLFAPSDECKIKLVQFHYLYGAWYIFQRQYVNMDNDQHRRLTNLLADIRSEVLPQPNRSYQDLCDDDDDDDDGDGDAKASTDCSGARGLQSADCKWNS